VTLKQWTGTAMFAAPFVGMFAVATHLHGVAVAAGIFAGIALLIGWIGVAVYLQSSE
jgi:hypothetical protein